MPAELQPTHQAGHDVLVRVHELLIQAFWGLWGRNCPTLGLLKLITELCTVSCTSSLSEAHE